MVTGVKATVLVVAAGTLAACGAGGRSGSVAIPAASQAVSQGPEVIVKGQRPAQLYGSIARMVRACWLKRPKPVLAKHVFRAEAGAGGKSGRETRIVIHEQTPDQKLGLKAFTIDFVARRDGTQILARNLKLAYPLGQKLVSDVGYWAQGGANCDGPAASAQQPPHVAGPVVRQ